MNARVATAVSKIASINLEATLAPVGLDMNWTITAEHVLVGHFKNDKSVINMAIGYLTRS